MDFLLGGGAAMCAGFFSNPLDVIKTRQQLQGELQSKSTTVKPYKNLYTSLKSIVKAEGFKGIQKGLSPALSFQFVMNSSRLGFYQTAENLNWTKFDNSQGHSPVLRLFWGGAAGILGSALGSPLYLVKTQIQSQSVGQYAVGYQHGHAGTMDAIRTIVKEQGYRGLVRGMSGLSARALVGSATQLTTFSACKDLFQQNEIFGRSVFVTALAASMVSGFFTVVAMNPFDVVATRLFNQGLDRNGKGLLYKSVLDCIVKTAKAEGIKGLYKGFVSNYWRTAPHTILSLTFWEQFKKWKDVYVEQNYALAQLN